jgi:hypothetical protein
MGKFQHALWLRAAIPQDPARESLVEYSPVMDEMPIFAHGLIQIVSKRSVIHVLSTGQD